jgi:hypothetical protein
LASFCILHSSVNGGKRTPAAGGVRAEDSPNPKEAQNDADMTPSPAVGSFCQFSVLVNGGKRWSMAVNENRWENLGEGRQEWRLPPRAFARVSTFVERLFSFFLPFYRPRDRQPIRPPRALRGPPRQLIQSESKAAPLRERTYHPAPNLSAKFRGGFNAGALS